MLERFIDQFGLAEVYIRLPGLYVSVILRYCMRSCLRFLFQNAMLLDLLLAPHVDRIFSQARQHGMIEFFRCYASVSLGEMAQQFCYTILELRDELTRLILAGRLPARIDSVNQILNRDVPNIFTETAFKIEEELNALRDNLRFCMIRTSMARNGLILKVSVNLRRKFLGKYQELPWIVANC